eukprot:6330927-Amphidinium_carterae.1
MSALKEKEHNSRGCQVLCNLRGPEKWWVHCGPPMLRLMFRAAQEGQRSTSLSPAAWRRGALLHAAQHLLDAEKEAVLMGCHAMRSDSRV